VRICTEANFYLLKLTSRCDNKKFDNSTLFQRSVYIKFFYILYEKKVLNICTAPNLCTYIYNILNVPIFYVSIFFF